MHQRKFHLRANNHPRISNGGHTGRIPEHQNPFALIALGFSTTSVKIWGISHLYQWNYKSTDLNFEVSTTVIVTAMVQSDWNRNFHLEDMEVACRSLPKPGEGLLEFYSLTYADFWSAFFSPCKFITAYIYDLNMFSCIYNKDRLSPVCNIGAQKCFRFCNISIDFNSWVPLI